MKLIFSTIIFTLTLLFFVQLSKADDFSEAISKAKKKLYESEGKNDINALLKVRGDFERILQLKKNEWLVNYYLGFVDFIISYEYVEKKDNDALKKYTESSIALLDKCTDLKEDFAEAWILKLAVNSNRWMYEPQKMNDILARQTEAKDMSKKYDENNPRFLFIDGMNTYYTPENFGGGIEKALPLFEKSYELFGTYKIKDETYPEWGEDQAMGMIAMCYLGNDKLDEAKKWIDNGLEKFPNSSFLKNYVTKEYDKKKK
jgi:tetratricopeptide (TPR) repeat protein